MIKAWQFALLSMLVAGSFTLAGCSTSSTQVDHYVSPQVQGEAAKINLEEVQKAFWDSKGKDFNSWMGAFEKRVNEIYDGKEVVSIDATRKEGKLIVTGYIDKEKKEGFQPGDEKLFTIEQTGEATEDKQMPYRVSDNNDRPYYEGRHSFLDNPFLQMMVLSHFMGGGMGGGWGGHYYTPYPSVNVLHSYRDTYRATPGYSTQQASNQGFFSRFKLRPVVHCKAAKLLAARHRSQARASAAGLARALLAHLVLDQPRRPNRLHLCGAVDARVVADCLAAAADHLEVGAAEGDNNAAPGQSHRCSKHAHGTAHSERA